ncbi:MAG: hypothetical protein ABI175_00770, partial [Polyangiales bacterium]
MASERRVVRFFGARGELLVADAAGVAVCNADGSLRYRVDIDGVLDVVAVGTDLWVATRDGLTRITIADGKVAASERITGIHPPGRFIQSSTLLNQPVWHGDAPRVILTNPTRAESPPGPAASIALPLAPGRWLLWEGGQLRYWRTGIGEAWRRHVGDPTAEAVDAQLVLEGRLHVLVQRRGVASGDAGLRLTVAQTSDGAQNLHVRFPNATRVAIAARTGLALVWSGVEARVFNLRFGRWIREFPLPAGVEEVVVDDGLDRIALVFASTVELTDVSSLGAAKRPRDTDDEDAAPSAQISALPLLADVPPAPEEPPEPVAPDAPLSDEPLVRLELMSAMPRATADEQSYALDLHLRLIGALANVAIATAWDQGRIIIASPDLPPFSEELGGLLRITRGLQAAALADAYDRLRDADKQADLAHSARKGRATPLEALTRDFGLSPLASILLFAIAAPRLRGELARVYGILANDPGRPLVDEHLLAVLVGEDPQQVSNELDADRPLRKHGLVHLGAGTRPFASLTVEPLVVRYLADLDLDGEADEVLVARHATRPLTELDLPRDVIVHAL